MKILLCVILLVVALLLFAVWPGKRRNELRLPFYGRNYAHRGLFGKDQCPPENSLPAFAAAAQNGYGIELDVQFTSDHRLVVFHDDTLDRMTPAKGRIGVKAVPAFVFSHCLGNVLGRPDFIAWCPDERNWAVRLCAALGAMMVMWTALPEHDTEKLEKDYDGVIFQWYAPKPKYK